MPWIPGNICKRLRTIWICYTGNSCNSSVQMSGAIFLAVLEIRGILHSWLLLLCGCFRNISSPLTPLGKSMLCGTCEPVEPCVNASILIFSWCKHFCWPDYNIIVDAEIFQLRADLGVSDRSTTTKHDFYCVHEVWFSYVAWLNEWMQIGQEPCCLSMIWTAHETNISRCLVIYCTSV